MPTGFGDINTLAKRANRCVPSGGDSDWRRESDMIGKTGEEGSSGVD